MFFFEVPAAGPDHERGGFFMELILLSSAAHVHYSPVDCVAEIHLTVDQVLPGRGVSVFKIGHKDSCTRIESVNDRLPVCRPGYFHTAVEQIGGAGCHSPVSVPDLLCRGKKIGKHARIQLLLEFGPFPEYFEPPFPELPLECCDEIDRFGGEQCFGLGGTLADEFDSFMVCGWAYHCSPHG